MRLRRNERVDRIEYELGARYTIERVEAIERAAAGAQAHDRCRRSVIQYVLGHDR